MANVIDIDEYRDQAYDRSCGECGSTIFTWHTFEEETHLLVCVECEAPYGISGNEMGE